GQPACLQAASEDVEEVRGAADESQVRQIGMHASHKKTNRRPGAHRAFPYPLEPPRSLADRNPNLLLDRHYQAPRNDTRGLRCSTMAADSAAHPAFANFGVVGSNSPCITRLGTSLTTGVFEFSLASDPIQVAQTCQSSRSRRRVP